MTDKPLTPTRIIPAGTAAALPDRAPQAGELPPWWEPAKPPPPPAASPPAPADTPPHHEAHQPDTPPAPAAQPTVVEVRITPEQQAAGEPPQPAARWSLAWARTWLYPWWTLLAALLAVLPMRPLSDHSAATTWAYTVGQAREQFGYGWGYALAFGGLSLAVLADAQGRSWRLVTRLALVITAYGLFGAVHWYDPITFITGVTPS